MTYSFLCDNRKRLGNLTRHDVDFLMVDYINAKCDFTQYCLRIYGQQWGESSQNILAGSHPDYKNMYEIYNDTNACYERSQTNTNKNLATVYDERIDALLYDSFREIIEICPDLKDIINGAPNMRAQTRVITSIVCEAYPELKNRFPYVKTMKLTMEKECHRTFTRSERMSIESAKEEILKNQKTDSKGVEYP